MTIQDDRPNGILPLILGQYIGAAAQLLPRPGPDEQPERLTEIYTGQPYGRVRIRYKLMRHKHGKSINWFWTAIHAEEVGG